MPNQTSSHIQLYSWNVLFQNKRFDDVFRVIEALDFDVICLQEVPALFLEQLKTLPYEIACCTDAESIYPRDTGPDYLVLISKHPIRKRSEFQVMVPRIPLRTRAFVRMMRPFGWAHIAHREGLWADIELPGFNMPVRVFCVHLILAFPKARRHDFEIIASHVDPSRPNIICGDFNTLEAPHITIFNWLLGGSILDVIDWKRERRAMESRFASLGLKNPLRGHCTHSISRSQLDHILVPEAAHVENVRVVHNRHGSDHRLVNVEITAQ